VIWKNKSIHAKRRMEKKLAAMDAAHEEATAEWVARRFRAHGLRIYAPHEDVGALQQWWDIPTLPITEIRSYDKFEFDFFI
jgi:hypothetical protein